MLSARRFENWTSRQSEGMGTVEFDLDWRAPIEDMRTELRTVLDGTELWDERVGILQITDATNSYVRVRILVSAGDSAALFDLRCLIREAMVAFLQQGHPESLPHMRWEPGQPAPAREMPRQPAVESREPRQPVHARQQSDPQDSQLFTGSIEAIERSRAFTGPGEESLRGPRQDALRTELTTPRPAPDTAPTSPFLPGGSEQ